MPRTRKAAKGISAVRSPQLQPVDSVLEELAAMQGTLVRRAYEIFEDRGREPGRALDDWLDANRELVWSPAIELTERDGHIMLEAAVAGLEPEELDVRITPEDVLIRSDRSHADPASDAKTYTCEFCPGKLFREVRLPARVDARKRPGRAPQWISADHDADRQGSTLTGNHD